MWIHFVLEFRFFFIRLSIVHSFINIALRVSVNKTNEKDKM